MQEYTYMDLHVAGEPFRLVTGGLPEIIGETMAQKRTYAIEHMDGIRKVVLLEPRGHADMYGGFLTPPVHPDSDFGIVFIYGSGMSTMCGHGVIAAARAAVELGFVSLPDNGATVSTVPVRIDAPSGTANLFIHTAEGKIQSIAFQNSLSFPYALNQQIVTPTYGQVMVDIGYGGAFMVFADIRQFGMSLDSGNISAMLAIAMECGEVAISQLHMVHPLHPERNAESDGICMILVEDASAAEENEEENGKEETSNVTPEEVYTKTFTVFGQSQFDRSPTGTGTSALAAILWKKGALQPGQALVNTGISGIPFRVTMEVQGEHIIPTIYSNAYVTGKGSVILEEDDPLPEGLFFKDAGSKEI